MKFDKKDENYIYGVIGRNVKKYRKEKELTQQQLADNINYSLSFVSVLESKKHQSFSLGALWRISLILGIDMYKLCIDDTFKEEEKKNFIKYKCNKCGFETEIPYDLIDVTLIINNLYTDKITYPVFKCSKCDGFMIAEDKNQHNTDNN